MDKMEIKIEIKNLYAHLDETGEVVYDGEFHNVRVECMTFKNYTTREIEKIVKYACQG